MSSSGSLPSASTPTAPARAPGAYIILFVMISAGDDHQRGVFSAIDEPMGIVDATRPKSREILSQGLRLSDPRKRMPQAILDQRVDPLEGPAILSLPMLIIIPGSHRPNQAGEPIPLHESNPSAARFLADTGLWTRPDGRHWPVNAKGEQFPSGC